MEVYAKKLEEVKAKGVSHVLVHEFMSIYYALAGWSGNRERRDERTKRKTEKEKGHDQPCINLKLNDTVAQIAPTSIYIVKPSHEAHKLELAEIRP
ncbi:hypothetical protein EVAR_64594_1 [Eumeta japonica]|uniref:Uncharacterized protein n=1 Tax=Eumeta variegata TaxID=151549 RepID=A0A4C1Z2A1_EUMVA|nr:hypothetical protein EVAR_64594_1 [Eumeta japonica]